MGFWDKYTLLEIVEYLAYVRAPYDSEEELSEAFDAMIQNGELVIDTHDAPAMREAFNNWTDSLCTAGDLHPEQYDKYTYVGLYNMDD